MSVPNTNTFSLNDVRLELGLGSTASLTQCFAEACAAGFDPAYAGSKNSLLNFRNYDHTPCTLSLSFSFPSYSAPRAGGSSTPTITAVGDSWQYVSGRPSWITISPVSAGAGSIGVTFTVLGNLTGTNRNANMIFRLTNNTSITAQFSVFQFA